MFSLALSQRAAAAGSGDRPQQFRNMFAIDDFASWDNPVNWWPSLTDSVLDSISHGARTLSYPRCQWSREEIRDPVREQWLQLLDQEDEFFVRDSPEDYADIVVSEVE